MSEILELVTNYGLGIVCVCYMIYFQNTTMKDMNNNMQKLSNTLESVNLRLSYIEDKLEVTNGK